MSFSFQTATAALSLEAGLSLSHLSSFLGPPHTEGRLPFFHFDETFEHCNNRHGEERILRNDFSNAIGVRSRWLQNTERSIRDHLTQFGTVLGAAENVRVQRRIKYLTWVLVILTFVVLSAALVPEELKQDILSYVKRFWPL